MPLRSYFCFFKWISAYPKTENEQSITQLQEAAKSLHRTRQPKQKQSATLKKGEIQCREKGRKGGREAEISQQQLRHN